MAGLLNHETKTAVCDTHGEYEAKGFNLLSKVIWAGCPQCAEKEKKEREQEEARKESEAKQRRIEARLNQSGIPIRYREKDFESYIADTDGKDKARATAMEFASNFQFHRSKGTVVVFSGKPGTGKSHLAIAIAQHVMQSNTALYTSAIDAVRMIRNTWRKDSDKSETEVLHMLASIDLLILDEVGVQYGTEAEQVSLFDIIDKRYRDMMPTILLTNLSTKGMKEFLGDRSYDRLREGGIWITFDWDSMRGK